LNPSPIPLSSGIWLADQKSDYLGSYVSGGTAGDEEALAARTRARDALALGAVGMVGAVS
jgi:hypothetical protein